MSNNSNNNAARYIENAEVVSTVYGITAKSCDMTFWDNEMYRGWASAQRKGVKPEEVELYRDAKRMREECEVLGGKIVGLWAE